MKAILVSSFGAEDVLKFQEVEKPTPQAGEVRVKMHAVGINPVETYIRTGHYSSVPDLPYTPGNDGAGEVDALGEGVQHLKAGQRVFIAAALAKRNTGTYAEYTVCDADAVQPLPDSLTFSQGAALGTPGLAATYALFTRGRVKPGETVLIHGATGGVGSIAVQLARRVGVLLLGTAGNDAGEAMIRELGANEAFNHTQDGYLDKIVEATGGKGPDLIIEMVAQINLMNDLKILAKGGRTVVVGSRGSLEFDPRTLMTKDTSVLGMNIGNMSQEAFRANMYTLSAAMRDGLHTVVGEELPLDQAAQAHRDVTAGKKGKIVLVVS